MIVTREDFGETCLDLSHEVWMGPGHGHDWPVGGWPANQKFQLQADLKGLSSEKANKLKSNSTYQDYFISHYIEAFLNGNGIRFSPSNL